MSNIVHLAYIFFVCFVLIDCGIESMSAINAIVTGSTGATGRCVVRRLVQNERIDRKAITTIIFGDGLH